MYACLLFCLSCLENYASELAYATVLSLEIPSELILVIYFLGSWIAGSPALQESSPCTRIGWDIAAGKGSRDLGKKSGRMV